MGGKGTFGPGTARNPTDVGELDGVWAVERVSGDGVSARSGSSVRGTRPGPPLSVGAFCRDEEVGRNGTVEGGAGQAHRRGACDGAERAAHARLDDRHDR